MCRNKVRGITRTLRKEFEYQMALRAREEPKKFWNYANSKLKTRSKIPDLYVNADKELTTNDYDKVEVLSDFFASVYMFQNQTMSYQYYKIKMKYSRIWSYHI